MVPVQVAEHHVEAAVGHALPPFVHGHDTLPRLELGVELGRLRLRKERRRGDHERRDELHCGWPCDVDVRLTPFLASNASLYSWSVKSCQVIQATPISSIVRWPLPTPLPGSDFALLAELSSP